MGTSFSLRVVLALSVVFGSGVAGCSCGDGNGPAGSDGGTDARTGTDAPMVDTGGATDTGVDGGATTDAGESDAGEPDAGESDAGEADAGEPDGGMPDAGPPPLATDLGDGTVTLAHEFVCAPTFGIDG